jgi:flagellar biosynthesis protein FlhG
MDQATYLRQMVKTESRKVHHRKPGIGHGSSSENSTPKVITISSGKGGVGKTNVTVNLAIACQRKGRKVLIFDADLGLANIDIIFGLNPTSNIEEIIQGGQDLSRIIVKGPEGVSIIPASSGVQELTHLTEGQKINLLNEFDNLNSRFDILLIDTSAGISSNVIYFNLAAEERIVVVTPEPTSVTDAYALIKIMFQKHGVNHFYLLMNMVKDEKEAKSVYQNLSQVVARFMGGISIDYAGFIPRDSRLQEAVNRRTPVISSYPDAASSRHFGELATYLIEQTERRPIDGNIKFFWKQLMNGARDDNGASRN